MHNYHLEWNPLHENGVDLYYKDAKPAVDEWEKLRDEGKNALLIRLQDDAEYTITGWG